jgi:hypothetical protein
MNCKRCGQEATLTELGICAACNCCSVYILEADEYKRLLKQIKELETKTSAYEWWAKMLKDLPWIIDAQEDSNK